VAKHDEKVKIMDKRYLKEISFVDIGQQRNSYKRILYISQKDLV
jgi:hypothetical protein